LLSAGLTIREVSKETGINRNTLKAMKRNQAISNQTVNGADIDEKLEEFERDNEKIIDSKSHSIHTLEELIEYCKIDLDVWKIDKHVINKWEVFSNDAGHQPLFQVKAWLSRRKPEAIQPVIQPINVSVGNMRKVQSEDAQFKRALIMGDPQIGFNRDMRSGNLNPFHDRRAIDIGMQLCRESAFDRIEYIGDWMDNAMFSDKFLSKPSYYFCTQPALVESAWIMGMFRKLQPDAEMDYIEGNHEIRVETMIMKHLLPSYGLRSADNVDGLAVMSMPNLLGLPSLNINYIGNYPAGEVWLNDKLVIRHGDTARKGSGATVAGTVKEATYTEIYGHIHRFEWAIRTEHRNGKTGYIQAFSPGGLCRLDGTVPGVSPRPNWQNGIAVVHYNEHEHHIEPILIENGKAFYRGKMYEGQDYKEQLTNDTIHHDKEGNEIYWSY